MPEHIKTAHRVGGYEGTSPEYPGSTLPIQSPPPGSRNLAIQVAERPGRIDRVREALVSFLIAHLRKVADRFG